MHTFLIITVLLCGFSFAQDVTFMAYNVKNFLETTTYEDGEISGTRYKPEEEISALVDVIAEIKPDLLGICEIGVEKDLQKLQDLLSARGIDYPYVEHVDAADSVRHLALLSKYPLKSKSYTTLTYYIGEKKFPLRRGLLHAEIQIGDYLVHALGIHLKSKRPSEHASESTMRLNEARLVREKADLILTAEPEAKVFLYGDFNDTFRSPPLSILKGRLHSEKRLTPLDLKAPNGSFWTYYWSYQRVYSTFDYILCSKAVLEHVDLEKSGIYSSDKVQIASDHRPLIMQLSFEE